MEEPSALEKIMSSPVTKGAANTVSAFGATIMPLAAFVPFLVDTLASGRHAERINRVLPVVLPDFHFVTCELPMAPVRMM